MYQVLVQLLRMRLFSARPKPATMLKILLLPTFPKLLLPSLSSPSLLLNLINAR